MLNTKITLFPGHIQSVYYQNILKIVTYLITTSEDNEINSKELVSMSVDKMSVFLSSGDVEAQERVCISTKVFGQNICLFSTNLKVTDTADRMVALGISNFIHLIYCIKKNMHHKMQREKLYKTVYFIKT